MSLSLVGLGVSLDITLKGMEELKKAEVIFAEIYTSPISMDYINFLEKASGKKIKMIGRNEVESDFLIKYAREKKVVLLVVGDPLMATTHSSLIFEAEKNKIHTKIICNSSIITAAAGASGLQAYRFGKTVTLGYWREKYQPTSPFDIIEKNLSINAHTLVLLDVAEDMGGPMDAKHALELLKRMQEKKGKSILEKVIVLSRVGFEEEKISYGIIKELEKKDLGKPLFSLIIPASLHPAEKEFLLLKAFKP